MIHFLGVQITIEYLLPVYRQRTALTLVFVLMSFPVIAETPRQYWGFSYANAQLLPDKGGRVDTVNLNAKIGYDYDKYFGAEFHFGGDVSSDGDDLQVENIRYLAATLRMNVPFNRVKVSGQLGLAGVNAETKNINGSYTSIAFGAGLELYGTETSALTLEYMQYGLDDVYQTLGIGFLHHFSRPRFR